MFEPVIVIVLAAQRTGVVNPLATRAGVSHKCLVPIGGRPLIEHVLDTVTSLPAVREIRVSLEPEAHDAVRSIHQNFSERGVPLRTVPSNANLVTSILAAAEEDEGPFLIITADNVLMTPQGIAEVREAMTRADAVVALSTRDRVLAAHPQGQRRFYEFPEAGYANCNLYGLANRKAFAVAQVFREGGQFMKNPGRMIRAFGLLNILRMRMGWISLRKGLQSVGRRFGVTVEPVIFEDGSLAIDVDNERTYDCCETILKQRASTSESTT